MGRNNLKLICLFLSLLGVFKVQAQTTTSKWISLEVGSAYGNRFLVNTNPSASYGFTEQELNDSFKNQMVLLIYIMLVWVSIFSQKHKFSTMQDFQFLNGDLNV